MIPGVLIWMAALLVANAAVVNGVWMLRHAPSAYLRGLERYDTPLWASLARGAYLLGVPVIAVALRAPGLRADTLGLPVVDALGWPADLAPAAADLAVTLGLAGLVFGAVWAGRVWFRRALAQPVVLALRRPASASMGPIALEALLLEAHWAFFRAGLLSLGLENATLALFAGPGLLGFEAWLNPATRAAHRDAEATLRCVPVAALAILSTWVFVATGSSVWCLAGHLVASTGWVVVEPAETGAEPRAVPTAIEPTVF